jgi:hypothetical protein
MSSQNCTCAVELLGEDQAGQGVGHGEGSEGQQELGAAAGFVAPAVRWAYSTHELLRTLVAALADPGGEGLRGHLAPPAVQQNGDGGCSALLAVEPRQQVLLGTKSFGAAGQKLRAALDVGRSQGGKAVLWREPGCSDMGQDQFHW